MKLERPLNVMPSFGALMLDVAPAAALPSAAAPVDRNAPSVRTPVDDTPPTIVVHLPPLVVEDLPISMPSAALPEGVVAATSSAATATATCRTVRGPLDERTIT
jgi:hypothetical protein